MKKTIQAAIIAAYLLLSVFTMAQINYLNACKAASQSEGSDTAVEQAMQAYGFNCAWYEVPTVADKLIALFTI